MTPSYSDGTSLSLLEAMACGLPIIATSITANREWIVHGLNGFLVEPNDIDGMIKAVLSISKINRKDCRIWAEKTASLQVFAKRVEAWITSGLKHNDSQNLGKNLSV